MKINFQILATHRVFFRCFLRSRCSCLFVAFGLFSWLFLIGIRFPMSASVFRLCLTWYFVGNVLPIVANGFRCRQGVSIFGNSFPIVWSVGNPFPMVSDWLGSWIVGNPFPMVSARFGSKSLKLGLKFYLIYICRKFTLISLNTYWMLKLSVNLL